MKRTYIFNIKKYYKHRSEEQKANKVSFPLSLMGRLSITLKNGSKLRERFRNEYDEVSVETVGGDSIVCFTAHKSFFDNYFDIVEEKE